MVGLGESRDEVLQVMKDARNVGVDMMTVGQYLQATLKKLSCSGVYSSKNF